MKKNAVLLIFVLALLSGGCEASKGAAGGISKDAKNTWHSLSKVDQWMRDHVW